MLRLIDYLLISSFKLVKIRTLEEAKPIGTVKLLRVFGVGHRPSESYRNRNLTVLSRVRILLVLSTYLLLESETVRFDRLHSCANL